MAGITVIVEPDHRGHRFQAVRNVALEARRSGPVLLLTTRAGVADEAFRVFLADVDLDVATPFDGVRPSTQQILRAIVDCEETVGSIVLLDADQALKQWWFRAPRILRRLPRRPKVVFMLTRYPARMRWNDLVGWKLRIPKASLALVARATGSLDRVSGFAGREDMSVGWVVKRVRDPEICSAHSRDRAAIRAELGLPHGPIVGIFGGINERKNAPMVWDAIQGIDLEAHLLLAGPVAAEVWTWLHGLPAGERSRMIVRDGFLSDELLDKYVAAADVAPIALTNNGPSGIMGKALAAGVPVVTAGSTVRAREIAATDGGVSTELDAVSIGAAIRAVLERDPERASRRKVPPATAEEFAQVILGSVVR